MAEMRAKHAFRYAKQRLAVGDSFETKSDRDALLLEAAGRAVRTNKAGEKEARLQKRRGRKYDTKVVEPTVNDQPAYDSGPVDLDVANVPSTTKVENLDRFYQRRDMEPE